MTPLDALFLGVLQGITEFLPVSSSGHLVIAQTFLHFSEPPVFFDIVIHVGTLLAVLVYFYPRLKKINLNLAKLTIIGTIPAVFVGLLLDPLLSDIFSSLLVVAIGLLLTSFLLASTLLLSKFDLDLDKFKPRQAFLVGLLQALAIIPGVSRSGSTVAASLQQGLKRDQAFYFSFLLAIPAIAGAMVLELKDIPTLNSSTLIPLAIGFAASAISGFFSLKLLKLVINQAKLHYFAVYCFLLSLSVFGYLFLAR